MMVCYRVDGRAGGKGRQPPGCGEWQGLLPGCTDCSLELLTTSPINISPPCNAWTAESLGAVEYWCCH